MEKWDEGDFGSSLHGDKQFQSLSHVKSATEHYAEPCFADGALLG